MTTTTDDVEQVTEADVRAAETAEREAAKAAEALEHAITSGSTDATLDDLESAERKSRLASLFARGQRAKADRYRHAVRAKQMKALRDEIITTAPKSGDDMVVALQAVEDAAREFMRLADAHDARVADWRRRIEAFQIPWGTTEYDITNYGEVRVNGITIDKIDGALRFGGIFVNNQTGYAVPLPIRAENDDARLAAYRALDAIGEGL